MIVREDTISLFDQDKQYVLDYLKSRGIKNRELKRIIQSQPFGLLDDAGFSVDGEEYGISHFLTKSDIIGYDIKKTNAQLNTDSTSFVALALVIGDDVLCYDTQAKEVFLWRIQTADGDHLLVSDNLSGFLKSINK